MGYVAITVRKKSTLTAVEFVAESSMIRISSIVNRIAVQTQSIITQPVNPRKNEDQIPKTDITADA